MVYTLESILCALKDNKDVELIQPVPDCPKHADIVCSMQAGHCETGNKRQCEQCLEFYHQERSIYRIPVVFTAAPNTRTGYVRTTTLQVRKMLVNGVIDKDLLRETEI